MGSRGPIPKRSEAKAGHRTKAELAADKVAAQGSVAVPHPDPAWHSEAKRLYASVARSAQARFYEPSDWHYLRVWTEFLSRQLSSGRPSAQMLASWDGAMSKLLVSEGDRRRARVEVERAEPPAEEASAKVAVMDRYRKDVG